MDRAVLLSRHDNFNAPVQGAPLHCAVIADRVGIAPSHGFESIRCHACCLQHLHDLRGTLFGQRPVRCEPGAAHGDVVRIAKDSHLATRLGDFTGDLLDERLHRCSDGGAPGLEHRITPERNRATTRIFIDTDGACRDLVLEELL